jgi:hypothetical protein
VAQVAPIVVSAVPVQGIVNVKSVFPVTGTVRDEPLYLSVMRKGSFAWSSPV